MENLPHPAALVAGMLEHKPPNVTLFKCTAKDDECVKANGVGGPRLSYWSMGPQTGNSCISRGNFGANALAHKPTVPPTVHRGESTVCLPPGLTGRSKAVQILSHCGQSW